jgi:hypothetical protein
VGAEEEQGEGVVLLRGLAGGSGLEELVCRDLCRDALLA